MKKLLLVLAIGAFAACNSAEDKTNADTTVVVAPDTTVVVPDTTVVTVDTTVHADSTKK